MSPDQDPMLTLFTLHGLAVSLRDRADTHTERAEALLLGVERAYGQQMRGEPVDFGELIALAEAAAAESDTSRRLAEKVLRGVRAMVKGAGLLVTLPKLVNAERVLNALAHALRRGGDCASCGASGAAHHAWREISPRLAGAARLGGEPEAGERG
jgi:hypothetical protein